MVKMVVGADPLFHLIFFFACRGSPIVGGTRISRGIDRHGPYNKQALKIGSSRTPARFVFPVGKPKTPTDQTVGPRTIMVAITAHIPFLAFKDFSLARARVTLEEGASTFYFCFLNVCTIH